MSTGTTPVVTAVKYEVDEHNLVNWLKENFGTDAKHEVCISEYLGRMLHADASIVGFRREWDWILESHCPARNHCCKYFIGFGDGLLT